MAAPHPDTVWNADELEADNHETHRRTSGAPLAGRRGARSAGAIDAKHRAVIELTFGKA